MDGPPSTINRAMSLHKNETLASNIQKGGMSLGEFLGWAIGLGLAFFIGAVFQNAQEANNNDKKEDRGTQPPSSGGVSPEGKDTDSEKNRVYQEGQTVAIDKNACPQTTEELLGTIRHRKGYVLHVTEYENLPSILQKGILSMKQLKNIGVFPKRITGDLSNALDDRKGTTNYVHLAFDESYSMFGAKIFRSEIRNPVLIKIDPRIIKEKSCRFSDKNAAAFDAKIGNAEAVMPKLDLEKIYWPKGGITSIDSFNYYKRYKQAEILIEGSIPVEYISEIVLPNGAQWSGAIPSHIIISYGNTQQMLAYDFTSRIF